jgi:lipopolysaccharide export system protein LptA
MCKKVAEVMKTLQRIGSNQNGRSHRRWKAIAAFWACSAAMAGFVSGIDAQLSADTAADSGPIQITADQLIGQVKDNTAEFIGNVEAVQGDFVIRSDRLQIHYRPDAGRPTPDAAGGDAIEKIVAIGHVRIQSGSRSAQTELAEYLVDQGLLVLKGDNSTVTDGSNSIKGSFIRYSLVDGKISVVGGPSERVRAVFHSTGRAPGPVAGEKGQPQEGAAAAPQP